MQRVINTRATLQAMRFSPSLRSRIVCRRSYSATVSSSESTPKHATAHSLRPPVEVYPLGFIVVAPLLLAIYGTYQAFEHNKDLRLTRSGALEFAKAIGKQV